MKFNKDKKLEVYLTSLNVLKEDYMDYYFKISEIVGKIAEIDITIALSLWKDLIKENECLLEDKSTSCLLLNEIFGEIYQSCDEEILFKHISKDDELLNYYFKNARDIDYYSGIILAALINIGKIDKAEKIINRIFESADNDETRNSFDEMIVELLENIEPEKINEEELKKINTWIALIYDIKKKAIAKVELVSMF